MTCMKCNHYFCWVCGLPVASLFHKFDNPFINCKKQFNSKQYNAGRLTCLLIAGLVLIPFALLFMIMGYLLYIAGSILVHFVVSMCKIRKFFICILCNFLFLIPGILLIVGLGLAIGPTGGAIMMGIFTIPLCIMHVYMYYRIQYWWRASRLT